MTEQEKQGIRRNMEDGFFQGHAKQPKESEAAVIRNSKEPDSVDVRELALIMMFHTVIDREKYSKPAQ